MFMNVILLRVKKTLIAITLLGILLIGFATWSPWMTKNYAETLVTEKFNSSWSGVADGCGFSCTGCGVKASRKTPFGYSVEIEYACGMLPSDSPEYHKMSRKFVSFVGTVH